MGRVRCLPDKIPERLFQEKPQRRDQAGFQNMQSEERKRVVLLGAGHAHLYVVRHARRFIRHGVELVLVDPDRFWYSGMGTGMLGGMYQPGEDQIDPRQLMEQHGGVFVRDRVIALDRGRREVHLASGRTISYDVLSLNVGSEVAWNGELASSEHVWTVKPIQQLWSLRQELAQHFRTHASSCLKIVVIGGGPTGCETAANIDALARSHGATAKVTIISRTARLAEQYRPEASRVLTTLLTRRGIEVVLGRTVARVESSCAVTEDEQKFPFDAVLLATGLRPSRTIAELGLHTDGHGGLWVTPRLQSPDNDRVFGAGDCITIDGHALPKLGVFAVRQSPVLLHNLLAATTGKRLKAYQPQKRYLAILNLGCDQGLATWGPFYWQGKLSLWLKDRIDRRFMDRYQSTYKRIASG